LIGKNRLLAEQHPLSRINGLFFRLIHFFFSMKRFYKVLLHLLFWFYKFGYNKIIGQFFRPEVKLSWASFLSDFSLSYTILALTVFYTNYFFVLPRFFKTRQFAKAWIGWLVLLGFFIFCRYMWEEVISFHLWGYTNYYPGTTISFYIFDNIYYGGSPIVMSFFIWSIINIIEAEKEKTLLQKEKYNAELSFLKNQVNPHFLFNTLNNIYTLSYKKDDKAPGSILKLGELMRYMLQDSSADKVPLQKEIDYLQNFIELQKLRYGKDCYIEVQLNTDGSPCEVPPLLFIPFVENAFKHGLVTNAAHPLRISLHQEKKHLQLIVENKKNNHQKDESSGIGLANIRRRLELIYPRQHQLHIDDSDEMYICTLIIEL
jgi:two-component system, LytTR family, sensor kinase